jgi:hypothetical protein
MTATERSSLLESTAVLCEELKGDDRDLGEILFSTVEEVPHEFQARDKTEARAVA